MAFVLNRIRQNSMFPSGTVFTQRALSRMVVLGWFAMLLVSLSTQTGCSYFKSGSGDEEIDLSDLEDDDTRRLAGESRGDSTSGGTLALNLKPGDRFPMVKRVEQRLTQAVGKEVSVYKSLTEMLLTLTVDEVQNGYKKLSVQYHRVAYSHDLGGKRVEYSSEVPGQQIPPEAMVYAGLKNNGFAFRLGPDNRVIELIGFPEFIQRCVRDIPQEYRQAVMSQVEGTHSENDLANFVDEGIGILPVSEDPNNPNPQLAVGSAWELKPRRSEGPIPMHVTTRCVLKELNDSAAEISMIGTIAGDQAPVVIRDADREMHVFLRGGHCSGTCRIDRRSGLPTNSQMKRYLELTVQLADGSQIQQRKDTLTSISSFTDQSGQSLSQAGTGNSRPQNYPEDQPQNGAQGSSPGFRQGVQSAAYSQSIDANGGSGFDASRRVTPAGSAVEAAPRNQGFGNR